MTNEVAEAHAGQAVYSKLVLKVYDIWVLGISNSFIWKCSSKNILAHFNKHVTANHLDIGVGTGYFLDKCTFPSKPRIGLMDLNPNSIAATADRIKRYSPEKYQRNILEPVSIETASFDSISINYLFHCLPGSIQEKAIVFDNINTILNKGGVVFGSTILQGDVERSNVAKKLMKIYNKKGIFGNENDTLEGLKASLQTRFKIYGVEVIGCVALFWAIKD